MTDAQFDRKALSYDADADIQRRIADSLLTHKFPQNVKTILDIGCGTGYLSLKLQERYPDAQITALDSSKAMLEQVRHKSTRIQTVHASAENWQSPYTYDLIVSSLAFQWFNDPFATAEYFSKRLNDGGTFAFNLLTDHTLSRFRQAFEENNIPFPGLKYPNQQQASEHLSNMTFALEACKMKVTFPSGRDLLRQMHNIGAVSQQGQLSVRQLRQVLRHLDSQGSPVCDCYNFLEAILIK